MIIYAMTLKSHISVLPLLMLLHLHVLPGIISIYLNDNFKKCFKRAASRISRQLPRAMTTVCCHHLIIMCIYYGVFRRQGHRK